ncbi:site-specific recombinase [Massilia sp. R2A-15]|uniref:site-specific recombinase n=1 Tax=Massilia sp. R2A-15 TaxID=3064278 RepID=UPI00273299CA|nr:site-specific recombinase [Massilia sp. R2A-15]WLI90423.1 site-specific recombinase [Massilia sp. R2A-15]
MLPTLERIAPDTGRIDLLVELVDKLRPPHPSQGEVASANVRALTRLLASHPDHAARLGAALCTLLEQRRHTSLYTDIGILSNDGFVVELKRRIAYRFLPPALDDSYLADAIDEVLYLETDWRWINAVPTADWLALFDAIAAATPREHAAAARRTTLLGMLDAIRTLSCRVCALGLEPRLIRSNPDIETFDSPFLMQNIEVNDYLDGYARMLTEGEAAPEDARHLLVMLDQCEAALGKIRKNAAAQGTSVALTYLLVALAQSIDRLRKLLFLVDVSGELPSAPTVDLEAVAAEATPPAEPPTSLRRAGAIALAEELIEAHNAKYEIRGLLADNVDLLARNVTENASRTGEHYIAETRAELRGMFLSSAGAGLIVGFMAMIKILLAWLRSAPLVEAFLFSMNYSFGFMLIHLLHFTVATKQPAMTAARIASGLSSKDGRHIDLDNMAELINKVFRTQCVAVLGNLATVLPTAWAIAMVWKSVSGAHLVNPAKAMHLLHDIDPFHSLALMYAAIAGVCLFVAGLISGYYDNKALYTRMAQRVRQLRGLGRWLGQERLARLSVYLENNLGGLMGNFYFGILLGCMGTLGYLLGLPLDIRHVTFSAANFSTALVALDHRVSWQLAATSIAGFLAIGAVNLLVSFSLALWVALRARNIRFEHGIRLLRALGRRFIAAPLDFFIGPKDLPSDQPTVELPKGMT